MKKMIALTFDDGPNDPYTSEIADFLASRNASATFFMCGKAVRRQPETARKVAQLGHEIGNHSEHHQFWRYLLQNDFSREIASCSKAIKEHTGITVTLFRPPWLWRTKKVVRAVEQLKLRLVLGSFSNPLEALQPPASYIFKTAYKACRPNGIVIFHDGYNGKTGKRDQTVKAVKKLVLQLQEEGYSIVTVTELLRTTKPTK